MNPPLSFYALATSTHGTETTLVAVLAQIKTGQWSGPVAAVRTAYAAGGKATAKPHKAALPGVTFSGRFNRRRASGLLAHSGLIVADLDTLGDKLASVRTTVIGDAHTVAAFVSPSGDGLKIVYRCDPTRPHVESFHAAAAHVRQLAGEEIDASGKDVARLCFVSHDPDLYAASDFAAVPVLPYPEAMPATADVGTMEGFADNPADDLTPADVAELLRSIPPRPSYEQWLRIASAVWSVLPETEGCAVLSAWSPEETAGEYAAKYPQRLAEIGVGTLIHFAREHGWKPSLAFRAKLPEVLASDAVESPLYFDGASYWRRERDGRYGKLGREDVKLHLKARGLSARVAKGAASELSQVEAALFEIQRDNRVTYAAPLCGRPAGSYQENGNAVLATDSPRIISPSPGNFDPLENFFRDLLGRGQDPHAETQFAVFVGWLQRWRKALANPAQHLPGQALFLVGPADCGKTLAQTVLTLLSGGRSADPSLWMFGRSDFNGDLWGAEHLAMSDANVDDSYAARRALRDSVKRIVANPDQPCHRKHRDALTLRAIWRLTVSANPDADSVSIIPPLDESSSDKVVYLKCYPPAVPFPTATEAGAGAFWKSLSDAAPAFLDAVESIDIPEELLGGRFGVSAWHHPEIVEALAGDHPDSDAADVLDGWLAEINEVEVLGSAAEIFDLLDRHFWPRTVWRTTFRSPKALGAALSRLSKVATWKNRIEKTVRYDGPKRIEKAVWKVRKNGTA